MRRNCSAIHKGIALRIRSSINDMVAGRVDSKFAAGAIVNTMTHAPGDLHLEHGCSPALEMIFDAGAELETGRVDEARKRSLWRCIESLADLIDESTGQDCELGGVHLLSKTGSS